MALTAGTKLGPYEIVAPIGAGGMGEVYRARDTKLNRTVAIKSLQAAVATDPERVARFEREAQLLASLNHPNIGAIYGLEQTAGAAYLVLEFVDGRPLDSVLHDGGAMPVDDVLAIAKQIADAIAAAHERGIIHRDLKPGNVMVTADGHVKVLDFGLGKAIGEDNSASSSQSNSPTMTIGGTQAGIILGTAGYMSPEQAKGRPADKRSDVWSFGCVLFEMIAGTRAFEGEDVTDTIAAIVRGEPNMKALPPTTPAMLRTLIERCLIKDRTQRLADMAVVRYVLTDVTTGTTGTTGATGTTGTTGTSGARWPMLAAVVAAVAALAIFGTAAFMKYWSGPAPAAAIASIARYTVVLPDGDQVTFTNMAPFAMAPNGLAFVYSGMRAGKIQLFFHDSSSGETRPLEGTDGARTPFFSPDGRWIGFFATGKLKKITVGGTALAELADAPDTRGGTWSTNDNIYYAPTNSAGLWTVPASGGKARELTKPDASASEISHRNPYALPDGKTLLFMVWTGPGFDEHRIELLSLADGRRQVVARNADGPVAVVNGQLVYSGRQDALLAAPWNPSRPSLEGVEPVTLPFPSQMDNEGASAYAASEGGTFVHLMGGVNRRTARIVWIDRLGKPELVAVPERDYASATISPDGTRLAVQVRGGTEEIWIFDFRTGSFTPLINTGGSSQAPVWPADSTFIFFRGTRQGFRNMYRKAADGSGPEERLTTKAAVIHTPMCTTTDGKWLIYLESGGGATGTAGSGDILKYALDGSRETTPVIATAAPETAGQVSPGGTWLSFDSPVSGISEVWVKPFGKTGGAVRQVSRDGGSASRWSRDGHELFFMSPTGLMVVSVNGDSFSLPRLLATGSFRIASNANSNYDTARDGRILHVQQVVPTRVPNRVEVVLNGVARR